MKSCRVPALGVVLLLAACAIRENIRPGTDGPVDNNSAILLMGVVPNYSIELYRGELVAGGWAPLSSRAPEAFVAPDNGYLLVKLPVPPTGALIGVSRVAGNGHHFEACGTNMSAPTFWLKAGSVTYVGDLHIEFRGDSVHFSYSMNEESAKRYLSTNFPRYSDMLETEPMVSTPFRALWIACNPRPYIGPIFIKK